ncbi:MAG: NHLP bacteriocin system secretion protein [Symploca sp. SIO2E9]|nr:NHLP bacteriocin system secretion protein [Symploca sp. SIO2E9]
MEPNEKRSIFREKSIERLSSPERLDQLMQVVNRKDWLPLSALGILALVALIWSIFGRIPAKVTAQGVLISPRRVVDFQSPIAGQLKEVKALVGDCVKKDEVLATIDPSKIKQKLELERAKLAQLQEQEYNASQLQNQRSDLEVGALQQEATSKQQRLQNAQALTPVLQEQGIEAIKQQRTSLQQRLRDAQDLTPALRDKALKSIQQQRTSLKQQLQDSHALTSLLQDRWEKRRSLLKAGALSADQVLQSEQDYKQNLQSITRLEADLRQLDVQETEVRQKYLNNLSSISEYQAQLRELDVKETQAKQKYLDNLSTISQLEAELQQIDTKEKRLAQENLEASTNRKNQIEEVKRNIAQFEKQYDDNRQIKSPHAGCILEVTASSGSVLNQGTRLGSLQVGDSSSQMVGVAYFPVGAGKKIKPGMKLQVTPDTVRRERFGGIVGTVTSVSAFPVTKQGATSLVGNAEVVEGLISQGKAMIEVRGQLQLDSSTPSGYSWSSSQGPPNLKISTGTTTTTRVTVEEQAPITFVLPILREWSGLS